jgi:hypothetical protein
MGAAKRRTAEQVRDFLATQFEGLARWCVDVSSRERTGALDRRAVRGLELAARRVRKLPDNDPSLRRLVRLVQAAGGDSGAAISFYDPLTWRKIPTHPRCGTGRTRSRRAPSWTCSSSSPTPPRPWRSGGGGVTPSRRGRWGGRARRNVK